MVTVWTNATSSAPVMFGWGEADGIYYMHCDAAGPRGWLCSLAVSEDLVTWDKKGPILTSANRMKTIRSLPPVKAQTEAAEQQ